MHVVPEEPQYSTLTHTNPSKGASTAHGHRAESVRSGRLFWALFEQEGVLRAPLHIPQVKAGQQLLHSP